MDRISWKSLALAAALMVGCSGEESSTTRTETAPTAPETAVEAEPVAVQASVKRGRQVYQGVCIACHAYDPTQDGAAGPALAGSSLELLEAKVLRNEYPPGYTPKRPTSNMVPLPHVEKDLVHLAAYFQSLEADGG